MPTYTIFNTAQFQSNNVCSLVPRPDPPEKEGPGIHCLRMRVIIKAKTYEEGHMTFPIHVLDDVTYCTRTKDWSYTSLIRCQLFQAYNPWRTVLFLWGAVSFRNTLTYQIRSVAIYRRLCLCKRPKWRLPALAWDAFQGYQASGGRRAVRDRSWTPLFDSGIRKLCRPINNIRSSSTSWLHGYTR